MRKYYIDNVRILCILLLIPFHTAMMFNNFGENFYVHGKSSVGATLFLLGVYPWWMSALFALAGMSTVYALRSRTVKEYVRERVHKLLIPFLASIVFLVPVQTYIADMQFNNYKGSYFDHLANYFNITDWSAYDGHFTTGHTWFILYLYLISITSLPLIIWYKNRQKNLNGSKMYIAKIVPLFLIILICTPILDIGGKSIGEFAACFLLGYFVLSMDEVQERLEKNCLPLGIAWIILIIIRCTLYKIGLGNDLLFDVEQRILSWVGIIAIIGLGKRFLEFNHTFTKYFAPAAFPIYILHQSVVVIAGYIIVHHVRGVFAQFFSIVVVAFAVTMLLYELCRRFAVTRFLFGIKR